MKEHNQIENEILLLDKIILEIKPIMPFIHTRLIEKEVLKNGVWGATYLSCKGIQISKLKKISQCENQQLIYFTDKGLYNRKMKGYDWFKKQTKESLGYDLNRIKLGVSTLDIQYEIITTKRALQIYELEDILNQLCECLNQSLSDAEGKKHIFGKKLLRLQAMSDLLYNKSETYMHQRIKLRAINDLFETNPIF